MLTHVKVLAVLHVALGVLGLVAALFLLLILGGVAGIVGAAAGQEPDAWVAIPILGFIGTVLFFFLVALSVPGLVAGMGLLSLRPWARILTLILSALNLLNVPLGTALGIYGLWVLLHKDTEALFNASPPPTAAT
jgi:hypothetical protein